MTDDTDVDPPPMGVVLKFVTRERALFPPTGDPDLDQVLREQVWAVRHQFGTMDAVILQFPIKHKED